MNGGGGNMNAINKTKKEQNQLEQLRWVTAQLISAQKREWYGKMTIEFKNGMVDIIRNEETLKPPKD